MTGAGGPAPADPPEATDTRPKGLPSMKTFSMRNFVALLAAGLALAPAFAAPAVIGNKNIASEKLDAATLKAVFLGKKVAWDGAGGRVILAVQVAGPVAEEFLKSAVDMTASAFNNHWRRLAMTGGGTAPKAFYKDEDVKKFVAETPGAIGFVDSAIVDASVATLAITP
jgi:ABC-type phosphate transport system substrate-binding protein